MSFLSSNWSKLAPKVAKRKREDGSTPDTKQSNGTSNSTHSHSHTSKPAKPMVQHVVTHVAMDCEMVGVGPDGIRHALARCSIVDFAGNVMYDKFVRPVEIVTDYRTDVSGVRPQDLESDEAVEFKECQRSVAEIIKGKVLIGHSIRHDLDVLFLSHPHKLIRDTAHCKLLCPHRPRALKVLVQERLSLSIQSGEHSSVEDARAVLALYKSIAKEWEKQLRKHKPSSAAKPATPAPVTYRAPPSKPIKPAPPQLSGSIAHSIAACCIESATSGLNGRPALTANGDEVKEKPHPPSRKRANPKAQNGVHSTSSTAPNKRLKPTPKQNGIHRPPKFASTASLSPSPTPSAKHALSALSKSLVANKKHSGPKKR